MYLAVPVCINPNRITLPPIEIVLQHGDYINNGTRCMMRCETVIPAGKTRRFRFAIKPDTSWPVNHKVAFDHIISQWRQNPGSPLMKLRINGGDWVINDTHVGKVVPGVFTEFDFNIRFAVNGHCTALMDGSEVFNEDCQTLADDERNAQWTVGIYRPWWNTHELVEGEPSFRKLWIKQ